MNKNSAPRDERGGSAGAAAVPPAAAPLDRAEHVDVIKGTAAATLRDIGWRCADLVYLDPPFGTGLIWNGRVGGFSDRFAYDSEAERRLREMRISCPPFAAIFPKLPLGGAQRAYLLMIAEILVEIWRVLKLTGSVWLHCDDTMRHYLQIAMEAVFGTANFLGLIFWHRSHAHCGAHGFGRVHDTIVVFARSRATRWRLWRIGSDLAIGDPCGTFFLDGMLEEKLYRASTERVGYPTQKPVALLSRILECATFAGDLVIDPTCGSGTTLIAAQKLHRRAIGIDLSEDACRVARDRLAGGAILRAEEKRLLAAPVETLPLFAEERAL